MSYCNFKYGLFLLLHYQKYLFVIPLHHVLLTGEFFERFIVGEKLPVSFFYISYSFPIKFFFSLQLCELSFQF